MQILIRKHNNSPRPVVLGCIRGNGGDNIRNSVFWRRDGQSVRCFSEPQFLKSTIS